MKKMDGIWFLVLVSISCLFIISPTRIVFVELTTAYPYLMGFLKTAVLASMGELMAQRIKTGSYLSGQGKIAKFFVWGLLGMVFVLTFKLFAAGVSSAQTVGLLPTVAAGTFWGTLWTAFLISTLMNVLFAPTFMAFHRITDGFIELGEGKPGKIVKVRLSAVIERIDWRTFIGFVVLRTIPLFWIPAHTITFLLPEQFRVLMAAYLSIALGIILSLSSHMKAKST
jgi:hypothetical protein